MKLSRGELEEIRRVSISITVRHAIDRHGHASRTEESSVSSSTNADKITKAR